MISGIIFILTFFQFESPRYLIKQGNREAAISVMSRLRQLSPDSEYVLQEIADIQAGLDHEIEATKGVGWLGVLKEAFLIKNNLYRIYLASMVQFLCQWTGAGSITLYAPDLFKILGYGGRTGLLVTAIFGIVKLVSSVVCAIFLVDVMGRKRALICGIALQTLAMIYVASFLTAYPEVGVTPKYVIPTSAKGASIGAIAMIYVSGAGWALGWNSIQYLLTSELYPLRIRAFSTSWAMTLHFVNQYGNSLLCQTCCFLLRWAALDLKTSGRSLESMERLLELPWCKIGLYGNKDADDKDREAKEKTVNA